MCGLLYRGSYTVFSTKFVGKTVVILINLEAFAGFSTYETDQAACIRLPIANEI